MSTEDDVLTPTELNELVRELATTKVLTVYHDARVTDPAMRHAWRPTLSSALRSVRAGLTDEGERAEFDRAAAFLDVPLPPLGGVWGAPGWVAFLTAEGPRYAAELPVRPSTLVAWREGPVVTPYLRALKQHRPVIVALVDSRSARFYRYAWGSLLALPEVTLSVDDDAGAGTAASSRARGMRGTSYPAPRAAVGTEQTRRRRLVSFRRLVASLGPLLVELAGDDGWVLIGGTPEWARLAGEALPAPLAGRVVISSTLDHDETEVEIARAAKWAATMLRARQGRALLDRVLEHAGALGRGAAGVPATQRALRAEAVNLLVLSPEFIRTHGEDAEDTVRAALAQGAGIEVLSGDAAGHLDRTADGIAARLRFAIDAPATPNGATRQQRGAPGAVSTLTVA
jgi:Bacterial archaeo-eukaryotic release factor family 10